MYIKDIRVKNYLIHQDTSLSLSPLTVFVGPNGGGKSAFFDAMLNFSMLARGSLQQAFGSFSFSYRETLYRGAGQVSRIGYEVVMCRDKDADVTLHYEIDYSQTNLPDEPTQFIIFKERLFREPGTIVLFDREEPDNYPISSELQLLSDRSIFASLRQAQIAGKVPHVDELFAYCTQQISRFNKFRLDPFVLSQPSRLPDFRYGSQEAMPPRIGYNGEDLAATLYFLSETNSPLVDIICEKVKQIEPSFSGFEFYMIGTDRVGFSITHNDRRKNVTAVRLSSGMLIYLGLIVLVTSSNRPSVLMIEEPENGLTPQAVKAFYNAVRTLATNEDAEKRCQVMISSHSPFVICEAWNGEDRDFIHQVKVVDGKTVIRKFSDVIASQGIQLAKVGGERKHLSLATAEQVMSGYMS